MNSMEATIKRLTNCFGFEIFRIPKTKNFQMAQEYGPVFPSANYRPWNKDNLFQAVFASIGRFTLVDQYRCFELWKLIEQVAKLKKGCIIEIGVWRGGTGVLIAKQAKHCGIKDRVFLCDTFTGVVKAGAEDSSYNGGEHADTNRQTVEKILRKMNLDNCQILEGIFPDHTGYQVEGHAV